MVQRMYTWVFVSILLHFAIIHSAGAKDNVASLKQSKPPTVNTVAKSKNSEVSLYIFNDKLKNVIAEVVRRDNISLKAEDNISGTVLGKKLHGTRHDILKKLSMEYDFDWFEYNHTLYVSNKYERSTKFFTVNAKSIKKYLHKLDEVGVNMDAFKVQYIDEKTTSISGPPGYIAIVSTIINANKPKQIKITKTDYNVDLYKGVKLHKIELDKIEKK